MGTQIRCKACSQVLAEFKEVPTDVLWYSRLRMRLKGKCPSCTHELPSVHEYSSRMRLDVVKKIMVSELQPF